MLVTVNTLLRRAQKEGYAVGAFNTYNLETTRAITCAAEAQNAPVIVQLGSGALKYAGHEALTALALAEARHAKIPVAVHLDHCTNLDEIAACVELGFTSVMVDGSTLPFAENIALTCQAVGVAHAKGVSIEAELGSIIGREDRAGAHDASARMTDPVQAEEFVCATKVDALAVAVGNVHGFYRGEPKLDVARLAEIRRRVSIPLVLHGASGLPDAQITQAIAHGICKFNVNTEIRVAFFDSLAKAFAQARQTYDLPTLLNPTIEAMQQVVEAKIELFGCAGKAL